MKIQDLVAYVLGGLGLEFDLVVCNIASKKDEITFQDAQFLLMVYESRLEQFHSYTTVDISQAVANSASKSANFTKGGGQITNNNRGRSIGRRGCRGGRYYNQRLICQLYGKPEHFSAICYLRFDQSFGQQFTSPNSTQCRAILFSNTKWSILEDLFHPKPPVHYPQSSSHLQPVTAPVSFSQLQLSVISAPPSHIAASTSSFYPMITRSKSEIYKPKSYLSSASSLPLSATTTIDTVVDVPASVQAVLADPKWNATMQSEFDALKRNKTGSLVPYSQDQTVIGYKWIFRVKYRAYGTRNGNGSDWFRISMLQTRNPLWTGCSKPNPCRAKIFNCRSRPIRSDVIYTRP
ncbi:hypothetical protein ACOSQ3_004644 [Xanthoceras sorbifolium]